MFRFSDIPDSLLQAEGKTRQKWVTIAANSFPDTVYVPLHQRLEARPITEAALEVVLIPVAVYKKCGSRGKYDDYYYCGDDKR